MRLIAHLALIAALLSGTFAALDACARSKDCCRGAVCHMHAGNCHQHQDTKEVVVFPRATIASPPSMPMPRVVDTTVASIDAHPLDGVDRAPDLPPRLVSPFC